MMMMGDGDMTDDRDDCDDSAPRQIGFLGDQWRY